MVPRFEWDEVKNQRNIKERQIDFGVAPRIWEDTSLKVFAGYTKDGEPRYLALGNLEGRLHAVVYTLRGTVIRIISMRIASRKERKIYER
jgi:uncharacterized DUF497 family protein